jgi:hypothetical protein
MKTKIILFFILSQNHNLAFAEIYKCKTAKGSIVYSESTCSGRTTGSQITIEPNVIDNTEARKLTLNENPPSLTSISTPTIQSSIEHREFMTVYKRDTRIRELNIDITDTTGYGEKRADASNELRYLKLQNPMDLSYELEQQRRNLKVGLTDYDSQKRAKALSALSALYSNYR